MTPREKAKDLFEAMYQVTDKYNKYPMCFNTAKQCAIIAVDEILESNPTLISCDGAELNYAYWIDVKKEIEKL
jgi:hypothetical protein